MSVRRECKRGQICYQQGLLNTYSRGQLKFLKFLCILNELCTPRTVPHFSSSLQTQFQQQFQFPAANALKLEADI